MPMPFVMLHQVTGGVELLLAFIGAAIILRGGYRREPDIIKD
jgi:hypothetical protein